MNEESKSTKKILLLAAATVCSLFSTMRANAQIVIKSPPVHQTAAAKRFVRPADPQSILRPARLEQISQPLQSAAPATSAAATAPPTRPQTSYDQRIKPLLDRLQQRSQGRLGSANKASANGVTPNPTLPVNFPGLQGAPFVSTTTSSDSSAVVASIAMDVNQDGKMDLVTVQNGGTVNVLLGSNNYSALKVTSSNVPQLLNDVYYVIAAQADMNKDGYPDLVVTDEVNNAAFVYINAKNGTFLPPVEYDFNFSAGGYSAGGGGIAIGDVNGDGWPDLVGVAFVPPSSGADTVISIVTMLNNGNGTFAAALPEQTTNYAGYINSGLGQALLTDMNKDGKLDLLLLCSGNDANYNHVFGINILNGNGDGTFAPFPTTLPAIPPVLANYYDDSIASFTTADVNDDGNPDLLFSLGYRTVFEALGNGDGTVQSPTIVLSDDGTVNDGGPPLVQYADVNGDGNIDIIGYDGGFTAVYLGLGAGAFSQTPLVQLVSGSGGLVQPLPADFTGDGKPDIIEVDQITGNAGLFTQSAGTFAGISAMAPTSETAQGFQTVMVGNVSGSGYPDIIAQDQTPATGANGDYAASIVAGVNDGKGNFKWSTLLTSAQTSPDYLNVVVPVAADLNNDGRTDLVFQGYPDMYLSLSNGDGTYAAPVALNLATSAPCGVSNVDIGDVNGDGFPDIVAAYAGDAVCYPYSGPNASGFFVLLNDGKGNFTTSFTPYGLSADIPKLVDLNGDGKLDLVLSDLNETTNQFSLYAIPGNGDGTFNVSASQYVLENSVVASIIPGDFNGDSKQDLVVGVSTQVDYNGYVVYGTTGTEMLQGNGDFTFQLPVQYTPGQFPVAGAYGDFNGDGRPDLALALETYTAFTDVLSGNAVTLINLGGGAFAPGPSMFTTPQYGNGYVFTADLNGDGAVDALFSPQVHLGFVAEGITEPFLNNGGVTFALTSSAASVAQDASITLTATLAPTVSSQTPTGTVSFYNNGGLLGAVAIAHGAAALTLSTLPVGSDSITAKYSGDSNFNPATASTAVKVTVTTLAPAFTLSAPTPASLAITTGQSSIATFALTSNATFSGDVTLSCSGMPAEASCTISPASVTMTASQNLALSAVVATTAPNNTYQAMNGTSEWMKKIGVISFASLFLILLPGTVRSRRSLLSLVAVVGLSLAAITSLTGCGGTSNNNNKYPGTPTGPATLTITATSGAITQTTSFTITVSQ